MMNTQRIKKLQREYGYKEMQDMINSGRVWMLEGSMGRSASDLLGSGACMLPTKRKIDYYGNTVPSRYDVKEGTKGSFKNCQNFWQEVENDGLI